MKDYRMLSWTPERVSDFWDYWSHFPETYFTYQFGGVMVRRLHKYLPGLGTVLDYGCGTGFMIGHLLDRGYSVTGPDFYVS